MDNSSQYCSREHHCPDCCKLRQVLILFLTSLPVFKAKLTNNRAIFPDTTSESPYLTFWDALASNFIRAR